MFAEAGRKEHGELSIVSYCFYTKVKVRHIIYPPISLSHESHMSMPNFKEVRAGHSYHLTGRQRARSTCETTNDCCKRCLIIPISYQVHKSSMWESAIMNLIYIEDLLCLLQYYSIM